MKSIFLSIVFATAVGSMSAHAQKTPPDPCDSIKAFYDQALVMIDSLMGDQIQLRKQIEDARNGMTQSKTEIKDVLKKQADTHADLETARKLVSEQSEQINKLEAEVKRLSATSSKQKGT